MEEGIRGRINCLSIPFPGLGTMDGSCAGAATGAALWTVLLPNDEVDAQPLDRLNE